MPVLGMARLKLAIFGLFASKVAAASLTCSTVETVDPSIDIDQPLDLNYTVQQTEYWSTSCGDLEPTCIINPTSTDQVVTIVKVLLENNDTFAIKSGGHNPNNYFASVAGGPLISTKNLNEIVLDNTTETVRVGPGNRWDDVSAALDGTGYTAVGGRIGNVGVGGYMLGGGLSFLSAEYGWAANSVLEFTLVLANASVVTVNETNYPDIFLSLKGGGNAFGIVTSYLLKAYPQGQVWGGNIIFDANNDTTPKILAALRDFTEYYPDEKAGIIMTSERTLDTLVELWIMFLFYDGPEPPVGVFDNFTAITHTLDTTKTQSMNELVTGNNWAIVKGSVYTIGTETTPLPAQEVGAEVLGAIYDHWVNVSNSAALVSGVIASIAFQPLPKRIAQIAKSKGGDLMDLDDDVDRIVVELDYSFLFDTDYATIDQTMQDTYNGIRSLVQEFQGEGKLPEAYLPLFQNDAFYRQDYFGRLRPENSALAKDVRDQLDPDGLWRDRTGGFKFVD
ncbi:FAD binding domain-containing protein [Xylariales sp. AK1849]|nr:FAD binding domain-containing protein [Xylariales sp. AK1849]